MEEKTLKTFTTEKGSRAEIYRFRILLNGKYCRFLGYKINDIEKKGCFLINELQMMENFINSIY